jgi:bifunctional polynucleotide phosphatase/kinase
MWIREESLLYYYYYYINKDNKDNKDNLAKSSLTKFISFDLDNTLIKTKSGKKFPLDGDDWMWWDKTVPDKLRELSKTNQIIIMSNQKGLTSKTNGKKNEDDWIHKLEKIRDELDIDLIIYASLDNDKFRKPSTGMLEHFNKLSKNKFSIKDSMYIGDAAGRHDDHSDSDRKFALNAGLQFYTPEMFFLDKKETLPLLKYPVFEKKDMVINSIPKKYDKEVIILIGAPASGKSTIASNLTDYVRINKDTLKTTIKCHKAYEDALKSNKNVVIDNTNPDNETRKPYVEIAKKYNYHIRCVHVNTSREVIEHNNIYRSIKDGIKIIPSIAYNIYYKKLDLNKEIISQFDEYLEIVPSFSSTDEDYHKYYY